MYWKSKSAVKPLQQKRPADRSLIKPSTRSRKKRSKRIDFRMTCYLLIEKDRHLVETTSINISKTGIFVNSLKPLETGQEVLCLLANYRNLKVLHILNNKNTLKGRVVRVEQHELLYKIAIQVTLGRVNPIGFMQMEGDNKYWWSRFWQGMDDCE